MNKRRAIGPDILRGLAILMVAACHMPGEDLPPAFWTYWQQFGWLGVDIFFVLSGYLIGTELLRPVDRGEAPDLRIFYIKRAFRILPVFWLITAVYFAFPVLDEGKTIAPMWRFLTFTVNFGLDILHARSFSHAWSLCVEEHFYLILPALVLLLRWVRVKWLPYVIFGGILIGGMALRHVLWTSWMTAGAAPVGFLKLIYYPSYCRLDGLSMGVALAAMRLFHPQIVRRFIRPWTALPLAALCFGVTGYMNVQTGEVLGELATVVFYPLFSLGVVLVLSVVLDLEPRLQALRWTGLGYVAAISYSFYLCQKLVYHADDQWMPKAWMHGWSAVAIYYISAIAVASVLYFVVERSFMDLRDRLLRRFGSRAAPPM